jgi:hypothetical protein
MARKAPPAAPRRLAVRDQRAGRPAGSLLDRRVAGLRTGVHRRLLTGHRPVDQVGDSVRVAGHVGDDVAAGPAGKPGRRARCVVVEPPYGRQQPVRRRGKVVEGESLMVISVTAGRSSAP